MLKLVGVGIVGYRVVDLFLERHWLILALGPAFILQGHVASSALRRVLYFKFD